MTCVGNTDDGKISKSMLESLGSIPSERAKVGKWANSMAAKSQLKPSVPSNTHNTNPGWLEWLDDNNGDVSEDLDFDNNLTRCCGAQGAEGDVHMTDEQGNLEMLVGVVETANSNKPIKTKAGQLPWACNIKKEKLKNVHLPIGAQKLEWHSKFIPMVMYWIGNSNFPWTISDNTLSNILYNIYYSVYKQLGNFEVDGSNGSFNVVCQRISEWRRNFSLTSITILMMALVLTTASFSISFQSLSIFQPLDYIREPLRYVLSS
ncbi:hypothetical protein BD769DRAFT_1391665 [Suillus cothurnatus]|nr:hypothetical protein BD769DRAFT_1391665 [Suillus cothurnatus]